MATELKLTNICGHTSTITAECIDEGTLVKIETTCPKIRKWGTEFIIPMEEMMDIRNNVFAENDKKEKPTPTCFIPAVVMNAVWIENGMISKNLAKKSGLANIEYITQD